MATLVFVVICIDLFGTVVKNLIARERYTPFYPKVDIIQINLYSNRFPEIALL